MRKLRRKSWRKVRIIKFGEYTDPPVYIDSCTEYDLHYAAMNHIIRDKVRRMKIRVKETDEVINVTSIQTCVEKVNPIGQHILHYRNYNPEEVEIVEEQKEK